MRRPRRERTCRGKRRYRDHDQAIAALHRISNGSTRQRVPRRAYPCPECRGYHLTERP